MRVCIYIYIHVTRVCYNLATKKKTFSYTFLSFRKIKSQNKIKNDKRLETFLRMIVILNE